MTVNQDHLANLDALCDSVTPYLKRLDRDTSNEELDGDWLNTEDGETAALLYQRVKDSQPEAGSAYWLTRTWGLLCWQPVYLALLSVHGCGKGLNFERFGQRVQRDYIAGFSDIDVVDADTVSQAIAQTGQQLAKLSVRYQQALNQHLRIRPGFCRYLLADTLVQYSVQLWSVQPHRAQQPLRHWLTQWLAACDLPTQVLSQLSVIDEQANYTRTSCCLVYQCGDHPLCADCPRLRSTP